MRQRAGSNVRWERSVPPGTRIGEVSLERE
jgi:hypothetical protein